jgi:hypothetical protein
VENTDIEVPCKSNPKLFFPTPTRWKEESKPDELEVKQAKTICETCFNKTQCLESAIRMKEQHGIWGGVNFGNSRERRLALRK